MLLVGAAIFVPIVIFVACVPLRFKEGIPVTTTNEPETSEYRSPQRKLVRFFERSRDQWKRKCMDAKQRCKLLSKPSAGRREEPSAVACAGGIGRATSSGDGAGAQQSKKENSFPLDKPASPSHGRPPGMPNDWSCSPKGHHYSFGLIQTFVQLILSAPLSLRGAGSAMQLILQKMFALEASVPCASTGRLWILRLGLHELTCPKDNADDWVWLVDHTIQLDSVQCMLVVGVRLRQWQQDRHPLEHHDLHFLLLQPGSESTGDAVCDHLLRVVERTGPPRAILTDGGRNLLKGIALFREKYPDVTHSNDIVHKTALCLKKILASDDRWAAFLKQCGLSKHHCAKTAMAFLTPPTVRDQARYMNLQAVLKWAADMRRFIHDPALNDGMHVEPWKVTIEFKWIDEFADSIEQWQRLLDIIEQVVHYIRWEGYHHDARRELEQRLVDLRGHTLGDELIEQLLEFVHDQSQAATPNERLLGSTECLESLIGKGKRLEGQQSRSGFTKMVLGMAACVVKPTCQAIQTALEAVKTQDLQTWATKNLGQTLQAKRRLAFGTPSNGTKTG